MRNPTYDGAPHCLFRPEQDQRNRDLVDLVMGPQGRGAQHS